MTVTMKRCRMWMQNKGKVVTLLLVMALATISLLLINWGGIGYAVYVRDGMDEQPLTIAEAQSSELFICKYDIELTSSNKLDSAKFELQEAWIECSGIYRGSLFSGKIVRKSKFTLCVRYRGELPSLMFVGEKDRRRLRVDKARRLMSIDVPAVQERYDFVAMEWGSIADGKTATKLGILTLRIDHEYEY